MFTPQIVKFENQLETLASKIQELGRALLSVNGKLDAIAGVIKANAEWQKKVGLNSRRVPKGSGRSGTPASASAKSLAPPRGP